MVKVRIPTPLRPLTGGKGEVETQAVDIQSMIDSLNGQFPGLKGRICDDAGEIRRFVNIYLNEEDIRFLAGKDTLIKDGDQISIVPAIAGGVEEFVPREKAPVLAGAGMGGCNEGQTKSGETTPAASNNHQAFGSSKLGLTGGCNGRGTG
jgi:molybdopterin synthase sulfur carrier subunit